jgi:hypothetical protein
MKAELQKAEQAAVMPAQGGDIQAMMATVLQSGGDDALKTFDRLADLYEKERDDHRRQAFNAAMTAAQMEMRPISTDATNPQTRSKYASYAALDSALRPIYTRHGFGLSFDTAEAGTAGAIRVVCIVSHESGYERTHHIDMPADGKGAKGGAVMTATHAAGAAMSYGMRYLLKMIFNVSVGEYDTDGNMPVQAVTPEQAATLRTELDYCPEVTEAKILDWGQCKSLEAFPAAKFAQAMETFRKHRKKREAAAQEAAE